MEKTVSKNIYISDVLLAQAHQTQLEMVGEFYGSRDQVALQANHMIKLVHTYVIVADC